MSELKAAIHDLYEQDSICPNASFCCEVECHECWDKLIAEHDKQIRDEVVEELEELHERYLNRYGIVGNHSLSAIRDAIEIVRGGENE